MPKQKCAGLYFLPAPLTMQAKGKAWEGKKRGLPSEVEAFMRPAELGGRGGRCSGGCRPACLSLFHCISLFTMTDIF